MEQINLNIIPDGVMPVCHASQFDKNRTIRFNLKDNGSVYTLAGTETITCKVRKPDDTENTINVANMSSSYVDVTFGFSDTDLSGYAMCELKIVNGAQTIGSRNFLLNVEADAYDGSVFEERSASGAVASFETNFIDNLTECIVDIDAIQDLHGYSKPWIGGAGKNKFDLSLFNLSSGWTKADGVITNINDPISNNYRGCSLNGLSTITLTAGTYAFSFKMRLVSGAYTGGIINAIRFHTKEANIQDFQKVSNPFVTNAFQTYYGVLILEESYTFKDVNLQFSTGLTNAVFEFKDLQLELGSTATSFEPYSNICPIIGFDSGVITRCGVNLWDEQCEVGYISVLDGTNSNSQINIRSKNYIPIKPNVSLYLKANIATVYCPIIFYDKDKNFLSSVAQALWNRTITTPENAYYMRFYMNNSYGTTYKNDISINYPSTDTSYHAYNGGTDTIPLGDTYYGGTLNVTTGELTVTSGYIASYNGEAINEPWISSIDEYVPNTSPSTGAEVVYTLATPTTVQLTPTEVRTLLEDNNIFADTGDIVSCKYLVEVT